MNSLTDTSKPHGKVRFIHKDGTEHTFFTAVNKLSGNRLSGFDNNPPDVGESIAYLKTVFRDIRIKAKVISYEGTKHFR